MKKQFSKLEMFLAIMLTLAMIAASAGIALGRGETGECEKCGEEPCVCEPVVCECDKCGKDPCVCESAVGECEKCGNDPCVCEPTLYICEQCGKDPCECEAAVVICEQCAQDPCECEPLAPMGRQSAPTATVQADTFDQLKTAIEVMAQIGGDSLIIEITSDFHHNDTITIPAGTEIELMSDAGVTLAVDGSYRHFNVEGKLTLEDGVALAGRGKNDFGGGVYVSVGGEFIMNGGEVRENTAQDGGGVYVDGRFELSGGEIAMNNSKNGGYFSGGGVYISNSGTFEMTGGEIRGNASERDPNVNYAFFGGAGVCVNSGTFTLKGGKISDNFTVATSEYSGGTDILYGGGGVHVTGTSGKFVMEEGALIVDNETINGGGVFVTRGAQFTMNGGLISDNRATNNAGGVAVVGASSFILKDGTISDNTACLEVGEGGGVGISGRNSVFTMEGGTIIGNKAHEGGGISSSLGTTTISGGYIIKNTAIRDGGGVLVGLLGVVNMSGGAISCNKAEFGAGIFALSGKLTMSGDAIISDNTATECGGGVAIYSDAIFDMEGGTIGGNAARAFGGGVYVWSGTFNLNGGMIGGDPVGECMHHSFECGSPEHICGNPAHICGNTAERGGGISVDKRLLKDIVYGNGTLSMNGGKICGNGATMDGGGVYVRAGELSMSETTISKNSANRNGGGMYVCKGKNEIDLKSGTFSDNNATLDGGAIFAQEHAIIYIGKEVSFAGNMASEPYWLEQTDPDEIYENLPGVSITVRELMALQGPGLQIEWKRLTLLEEGSEWQFYYLANNYDLNFNGSGLKKNMCPGVFDPAYPPTNVPGFDPYAEKESEFLKKLAPMKLDFGVRDIDYLRDQRYNALPAKPGGVQGAGVLVISYANKWSLQVTISEFTLENGGKQTLKGFKLELEPNKDVSWAALNSNTSISPRKTPEGGISAGISALIAEGTKGVSGINLDATLFVPVDSAEEGRALATVTWTYVAGL